MKKCFLLLSVTLFSLFAFTQPMISSFSPTSGAVGTSVTITGSNFDPVAANNIVYFGAVKAVVTAATATSLSITIPIGATYQPISVTTGNLTGFSSLPFLVTFSGGVPIMGGSFNNVVTIPTIFGSRNSLIMDMDGDGKPDISTLNNNGISTFSTFRNTSTPSATSFAPRTDYPTLGSTINFAASDLDGDGKPDITVCNGNGFHSVSFYRNTSTIGTISFTPKTDIPTGIQLFNLTIADIDVDGKPDIIFSGNANSFSILRNTSTPGNISFASKIDIPLTNLVNEITAADLDGDGKTDLGISLYNGSSPTQIRILKNTSIPNNFSFITVGDFASAGLAASLIFADFTGDNKPDMAIANYQATGSISIFKNTTTGGNIGFTTSVEFSAGDTPTDICSNDFDGDGLIDIGLVYYHTDSAVAVLKNNSSGGSISFASKVNYFVGLFSQSDISAGDIDGDGKPDMLATDKNGYLRIYRNKSNEPIITGFTPTTGITGTAVTINGFNFINVSGVRFGSIPASSFTVNSANSISATVASGESGNVSITASLGTGFLPGFTFGSPTIISFAPLSGLIGDTITITGTNFNSVPANNLVWFGAVKATVLSATANSLSVVVPVGASYKPISVTTNNLIGFSNTPFNVLFQGGGIVLAANSFAPKVDFTTGASCADSYVCDLNEDGKPELVTANVLTDKVSVFRNTSTSTSISFATKVDISSEFGPNHVIAGDLNGDGKPELVVSAGGNNKIRIFKNNSVAGGAINFSGGGSISLTFPGNQSPYESSLADFDGDGRPDIAVTNVSNPGLIYIFRNTSTVTALSFAERSEIATGLFAFGITTGDIDGDGKTDIVVTNYGVNNISVLRNTTPTGNGNFSFTKIDLPTGVSPYSISIANMDADTKPDLVIANSGSNTISVYKNLSSVGIIQFLAKVDYNTGTSPQESSVADLDGDGKVDIAVVNKNSNTVSVFRNISTLTNIVLAPKVDYATGIQPVGIFSADLNGDAKPDMAIANVSAGSVSILKNKIANPDTVNICPGGSTALLSNLSGATYQWQVNTGTGFVNISDNVNYTGTATNTIQLNNIPSAWTGYQYSCLVNGNNGNITEVRFSNVWTGTINSSWENPANWSCGTIPDINTDVVINSGTIVINSNVTIRSLTLATGVNLTINSGYTLTITH